MRTRSLFYLFFHGTQWLTQCLAHRRPSINFCWINEWTGKWMDGWLDGWRCERVCVCGLVCTLWWEILLRSANPKAELWKKREGPWKASHLALKKASLWNLIMQMLHKAATLSSSLNSSIRVIWEVVIEATVQSGMPSVRRTKLRKTAQI